MCEYCGCKQMPAIGELMAEHAALLDEASGVRGALDAGDRTLAHERLTAMVGHLVRHVDREEAGVFTALREDGEFADEVAALEGEHRDLDSAISALDPSDPGYTDAVLRLFDDLAEHIEREDLGVFPVSVVTLRSAGWDVVTRAHEASPTFLDDPAPATGDSSCSHSH